MKAQCELRRITPLKSPLSASTISINGMCSVSRIRSVIGSIKVFRTRALDHRALLCGPLAVPPHSTPRSTFGCITRKRSGGLATDDYSDLEDLEIGLIFLAFQCLRDLFLQCRQKLSSPSSPNVALAIC